MRKVLAKDLYGKVFADRGYPQGCLTICLLTASNSFMESKRTWRTNSCLFMTRWCLECLERDLSSKPLMTCSRTRPGRYTQGI